MIKRSVTAEEYEKLPEVLQAEYEQEGDGYVLKTPEGFVTESEHKEMKSEFRDTNVEVMKDRDSLKKKVLSDDELKEYKELKKSARKAETDQLKDEDKFEEWRSRHEADWEEEKTELGGQITGLKTELEEFKLTNKVRAAALEAGVSADYIEDVLDLTKVKGNFQLDESDGKTIRVFDDDGAPMGKDPKKFFDGHFKKTRPRYYDGSGSGGTGADQADHIGSGGGGGDGDGDVKVIPADDQDAFNRSLEEIADGKAQRASA